MSRLGKLPIALNDKTKAKFENGVLVISGPKGELKESIHKLIKLEISDVEIKVNVNKPDLKRERELWGLFRSLINNMVEGVNNGFEKKLEVNGVGYRVAASGRKLNLNVGYSHPVEFDLPEGINASVEGNTITISGINKQSVGEIAAQIRKVRAPEPYKGKGIKYIDEIIRRKAGKTAAKGE